MRWPKLLAGSTPKRILIRLTALGGVLSLGIIAIAQAQRFGDKTPPPAAAAAAEGASRRIANSANFRPDQSSHCWRSLRGRQAGIGTSRRRYATQPEAFGTARSGP